MDSTTKDSADSALAMGLDLLRHGKPQDAEPIFDKILLSQPDNFDALRLRGVAAHLQARHEQAVSFFRKALAVNPDSGQVHHNLGVAFQELKRHEEALESFGRAIEIDPSDSDAGLGFGTALMNLNRNNEAAGAFRKALEIDPGLAEAHCNLGAVYTRLGELGNAADCFQCALAIDPKLLDALINLGGVLSKLNKNEDAAKLLRQAISVNNRSAVAYNTLGVVLSNLRQYEEARDCFKRAIEIDPDYDAALSQGALVTRRICDWSDFSETQSALTNRVRKGRSAVSPFVFLTFSDDPADQFACARNYAQYRGFAGMGGGISVAPEKGDRIRVAYVSGDFREHPVAYQMAELFERHGRDRFEVIGISMGKDDGSAIRERIVKAFDAFVEVRDLGHQAVAELIAEKQVHIAVDLNGHTADARPEIFARRPAPIQVNYLGFPCTMGTDFIDYIVVDPHIAAMEQQPNFAERLVQLPDSYLATDSTRAVPEPSFSRQDVGLPEEGFVFCCFHNSYKITPDVFDRWMRLLSALPDSVIWLRLDDETAIANLRREAKARKVDPDRLVVAGRMDMDDHMARHRLADLFLDALPYNAHSSATDALWAGLPVLTCAGNTFAARVGSSLLHAVGLPELITHTLEDYEALALKLARDPDLLSATRNKLAKNRTSHPLFDCARSCRHLEAAYETMFETWKAGTAPAAFSVEPLP